MQPDVSTQLETNDDINITGTLVWYYYICKREVWLMARNISPDQDNELLDIGRFIHEHSYSRKEKEFQIDYMKFDVIENKNGTIIVEEMKKSSKFIESSRMQLLFYLYELSKMGIEAEGLLLFPEEKKKENVMLDEKGKLELEAAMKNILDIISLPKPPEPIKIKYCRSCAYSEFCWS